MEPAPYPQRNTEEIQAVATLFGLLDLNRVKLDAKFLDKVPNLDGSVELVDEGQRPIGELKIQIKKIPDGAQKFDCPVELVAYSTRVSSPFLLVCVDVGNQKAYWCHISRLMPELKEEQKTFTVKFQLVVDEIGPGFPYFERWLGLCRDYLQRVSEFPRLRQKLDEEIGLTNLAAGDRRGFQQFIEEINVLLDVDLPVVKHEFFADTWKLGISVHRADTQVVAYSIYTIPNGENAPLVIHEPAPSEQPRISFDNGQELTDLISVHLDGLGEVSTAWMQRASFEHPVEAARDFVLRYFIKLLQAGGLHVHGRHVSAELLIRFLDEYAHTFGLTVAETYKLADISYGLNVFFPMWYALSFPVTMNHFQEQYPNMLRHNPWPSFEQIANMSRRPVQPSDAQVRAAIESGERAEEWPLRFDDFSIESLRQAVDYLVANNVDRISALYRPWTRRGLMVWECYALEDLKTNTIAMLRGAAEDYAPFVKGNRFGRTNCPLISGEMALIAVMSPSTWHDSEQRPTYDEYLVENADRSLPLLTIIDAEREPEAFQYGDRKIVLRGVGRKWWRSRRCDLPHFVREQPIRAMLYRWLVDDLEQQFGRRISI